MKILSRWKLSRAPTIFFRPYRLWAYISANPRAAPRSSASWKYVGGVLLLLYLPGVGFDFSIKVVKIGLRKLISNPLSKMHYTALLSALLAASSVQAHSTFQQLWVNGVDKAGTCARAPLSNSPVTSVSTAVRNCLCLLPTCCRLT